MPFEWKDRYKLGIEEIDKQHRKLFEIGARVYDLAVLNDEYDHYDEIMVLIDELFDYTKYHFGYEEEFIGKYHFDGLEQQREEHEFYISKMKSISSKDVDNNQQQTTIAIVDFLSEWISGHILLSDRKYAAFFKENNIAV
jgi:hemerythrin